MAKIFTCFSDKFSLPDWEMTSSTSSTISMIFRLLEAQRLVTALETREVDSQMWSTSLTDFPGKNAPFGKEILSFAGEVNAKHHSHQSCMSDKICSEHSGT